MANDETLDLDDPQQRPRYSGLPSFFRLPWREDWGESPPAIGVIGVPFDGGVTNRPGPRHGPREVRNASSLIRKVNQATGIAPFDLCEVADVGDAWVRSPYELEAAHREIESRFNELAAAGIVPLTCGGDHSISLPILRALAKDRPVGMIHIDAHCDTGDNYMGSRFHHGAPFKVAVDEGLLDPKRTAQIGIRGTLYGPDMWRFSYESGMRVMQIEEVEERGWRACIEEAKAFVGDGPVYVSFDIDALDPSIAPGTGTPESGGLTMREAQGMVRALDGMDVVGADMVEVSPPFDQGNLTSLNGATMMFEILCVMARAVAARGA